MGEAGNGDELASDGGSSSSSSSSTGSSELSSILSFHEPPPPPPPRSGWIERAIPYIPVPSNVRRRSSALPDTAAQVSAAVKNRRSDLHIGGAARRSSQILASMCCSVKSEQPQHVDGKSIKRRELLRPMSVRRLSLLVSFLNSLDIWPRMLTIVNLGPECRSGLFLCNLMSALSEQSVSRLDVNPKPLCKSACIKNWEIGLRVIWNRSGVNRTQLPTAEELYDAQNHRDKLHRILEEIVEAFVLRGVRTRSRSTLRWFDQIVSQYGLKLPDGALNLPFDELWPAFQGGTRLFCTLFHHMGQSRRNEIDTTGIYFSPLDLAEYRVNVTVAFELLEANEIPVLFTVEDWLASPDRDFLLLQLSMVERFLGDSSFSISPTSYMASGIALDANGQAVITGLEWADSTRVKQGIIASSRPVRLGDGMGMTIYAPPLASGRPAIKLGQLPGLTGLHVRTLLSPSSQASRGAQCSSPRNQCSSALKFRYDELQRKLDELQQNGGSELEIIRIEDECRAIISARDHVEDSFVELGSPRRNVISSPGGPFPRHAASQHTILVDMPPAHLFATPRTPSSS
jgi:hypothetical protein